MSPPARPRPGGEGAPPHVARPRGPLLGLGLRAAPGGRPGERPGRWARAGAAWLLLGALLGLAAPAWAQVEDRREADYREVATDLPKPAGEGVSVPAAVDATRRAANALRRRHGLRALEPDQRLARAAQDFAEFLARHHRVGHTADGRAPAERAAAAGYRYCSIRENLAYEYDSRGFAAPALAAALLEGWRTSRAHRENLLDPFVTDTGIGVARSDATGAYFAVHLLGRPAAARVRFEVVNATAEPVRYRVSVDRRADEGRTFRLAPRAVHVHERCRPVAVGVPGAGDEAPVAVTGEMVVRLTSAADGTLRVRPSPRPPEPQGAR